MAIKWAPILLAAVKPGAAELTKAAKQKLLPGELEQALSKALAAIEIDSPRSNSRIL
jgi:hypothetical protein